MYQGKIIERGLTSEVLKNPQEEYTKELINIVVKQIYKTKKIALEISNAIFFIYCNNII